MILKRVSDFLLESLSEPIKIDIDFGFDKNPDQYTGNTNLDRLKNLIYEVLLEGGSLNYIQKFEIIEERSSSGWPKVRFYCKNVNDVYDLLIILWAEDIDMVIEYLYELLCSEKRFQDAFKIVKSNYSEAFNFLELKDDFINALKDEDRNFILSIKGINKYNL